MAQSIDAHIRTAKRSDEDDMAHVCLKTAISGQDASSLYSKPELPGMIWAIPYLVYAPENCFVVELGRIVVGYVVTVPDTRAFETWQRKNWWPEVHSRLASFKAVTSKDHEFLAALGEAQLPVPAYADEYPAHLHINLLPEAQGGGFGRRLIETATMRLKELGVRKLHLGVSLNNPNAVGFYKVLGFSEFMRDGSVLMGKSL